MLRVDLCADEVLAVRIEEAEVVVEMEDCEECECAEVGREKGA